MKPSDLLLKWAILIPYPLPDNAGERWGWIGMGGYSDKGEAGFETREAARQSAEAEGFQVEERE